MFRLLVVLVACFLPSTGFETSCLGTVGSQDIPNLKDCRTHRFGIDAVLGQSHNLDIKIQVLAVFVIQCQDGRPLWIAALVNTRENHNIHIQTHKHTKDGYIETERDG